MREKETSYLAMASGMCRYTFQWGSGGLLIDSKAGLYVYDIYITVMSTNAEELIQKVQVGLPIFLHGC